MDMKDLLLEEEVEGFETLAQPLQQQLVLAGRAEPFALGHRHQRRPQAPRVPTQIASKKKKI